MSKSEVAESDHRIDYRLRRGRVGGMTVAIAPGPDGVAPMRYWDEVDKASILAMDDRAFGIAERFLVPAWGRANNYGRCGVSAIPSAVWTEVLDELEGYRDRLASAKTVLEARPDGDSLSDQEACDDLAADFDKRRPLVVAFLDDLITTTRPWAANWSHVFFFGL